MTDYLELLDWRRLVADLYVELRRRAPDQETLAWFRSQKDALYREHAQSPIAADARASFANLHYWPYDPEARVQGRFVSLDETEAETPMSVPEDPVALLRIGRIEFTLNGTPSTLDAFWVNVYGGGLFVPFKDGTSGHETYGGGRYLLDTIKSADLGSDVARGMVVLDFNYAYHPSCAFDAQWVCPLAPPQNVLPMEVRAGERLPG